MCTARLFLKSLVPTLNALGLGYLWELYIRSHQSQCVLEISKLMVAYFCLLKKTNRTFKLKFTRDSQVQNPVEICSSKNRGHCLVLWHLSPGRPGGGQRWPTGLGDVALRGVADVARALDGGAGVGWLRWEKLKQCLNLSRFLSQHCNFLWSWITYDQSDWLVSESETRNVICEEGTLPDLRFVDRWCSGRPGVWLPWILARFRKINWWDENEYEHEIWRRRRRGKKKQKKKQKTLTWCRKRTWRRWRWHPSKRLQIFLPKNLSHVRSRCTAEILTRPEVADAWWSNHCLPCSAWSWRKGIHIWRCLYV